MDALLESCVVPHALPMLGGGSGDLPVKKYSPGVWLASTLGFSLKRGKQGDVNGRRPGRCMWRQIRSGVNACMKANQSEK